VLEVLDAAAVRRWCTAGREGLLAARTEIDDLNVYPVPDGDTGTNLLLTMEAAERAVAQCAPDMAATARAMAHGALMGARGNSGVILSQLLRGLAEVLAASETSSAADVRRGLARAAELGYAAVASPVEGTVLTVARECAEAVAGLEGDLASVVREASAAAGRSLARTPALLPQLEAAGVVDAGGRGLCVLLEALEAVVTGVAAAPAPAPIVARDRRALTAAREAGSDEFHYEVQFLLSGASDAAVEALREQLAALGDSLVVVGGGAASPGCSTCTCTSTTWALPWRPRSGPAGRSASRSPASRTRRRTRWRTRRQTRRRRTTLRTTLLTTRRTPQTRSPQRPAAGRGVVAVAPGPGLAQLFREAGAEVVLGGPTCLPSTAELLAAVHRVGCAEVVLLPNDAASQGVAASAAAAAREQGWSAAVVPDPVGAAGAGRPRGGRRRAPARRRRGGDGGGSRLDPLGRGDDRRAAVRHDGGGVPARRRAGPARGRGGADRLRRGAGRRGAAAAAAGRRR
jgi:dihydroxyacetone kinase-like predicted kinase